MQLELVILFFIVAFVYSSVGFGGGSSYLALLTLYGTDYMTLRVVALVCNITVVLGSVIIFWKMGLISWKKITPLIMVSIPAAYLGGFIQVTESFFFILLGFTLLAASLAMFFQKNILRMNGIERKSTSQNSLIGGGIGFLSGLVGIGGGIFLSPVLHLIKWDNALKIGAAASIYILFNSIAGLLGQSHNLNFATLNLPFVLSLMLAVFVGGQLGVRLGVFKLNPNLLRRVTAVLVLIVSIRILYKYLQTI